MRPPTFLLKNHRIPHRDGPPLLVYPENRRGRAYPQSVELMAKSTSHIPESHLLRISSAISFKPGKCVLLFPVSNSLAADYVPHVWEMLEPRYRDFGIEIPSLTFDHFWPQVTGLGIDEVELIKLDCERLKIAKSRHICSNMIPG